MGDRQSRHCDARSALATCRARPGSLTVLAEEDDDAAAAAVALVEAGVAAAIVAAAVPADCRSPAARELAEPATKRAAALAMTAEAGVDLDPFFLSTTKQFPVDSG